MTNNEENYKDKECPLSYNCLEPVPDQYGIAYIHNTKYCNTTHCAAWQRCGGTVKEPIYGCRFIERGWEY